LEQPENSSGAITIGHSDRDFATFSELLVSHGVVRLIDVRRYPNSRRHPQFNEGNLKESLDEKGINYEHWPEIGGYRDPAEDSSNTALEGGFRGVADHLNTEAGQRKLDQLAAMVDSIPQEKSAGLMCAEKDPQHCHRKIISDHLLIRGIQVLHLIEEDKKQPHELHPNARKSNDEVTYPGLL
jgi:uncharacterized protein (DUF488 family)